jgi:hypothetical protein
LQAGEREACYQTGLHTFTAQALSAEEYLPKVYLLPSPLESSKPRNFDDLDVVKYAQLEQVQWVQACAILMNAAASMSQKQQRTPLEQGSFFVDIEGFPTDIHRAACDLFTSIHTDMRMTVRLPMEAYTNECPTAEMVSVGMASLGLF